MKFKNLNKELENENEIIVRQYNTTNNKRINQTLMGRKKKNLKNFLVRITIVFVIIFALLYLPLRGAYQSAKQMGRSAKGIVAASQNQNLDEINKYIKEMKGAANGLDTSLSFLFWLRIIPYFGSFYADSKHFAKAATYELAVAEEFANSLIPYKNELGFTGQSTPGQDKVAQLVKILDKINPELDDVEPDLNKARKEVEGIDILKYPEKFGKYNVRSLIDTAKNFIIGAHYAVTEAKEALFLAPSALGEPNAKNYLIIFQNDKELRATGGFMTAYAFLRLDKGHINSSQSDDIYRLDEKLLETCLNVICPLTPPEPIVKYLPEANGKPRSAWSLRDSNLSPDVSTSMRQFEKLYSFLKGAESFDGIILIDTHVVEELIKITGPIEVFGTKYSADKDPRCSCPNVIFELESYAQIIERGEKDRKAILGTLMQQLLAKSLSTSTEKLPEFINTSVKLANAKHVIFYMHEPKLQQALVKLNWTGAIKTQNGDYLHINDSNFAGGKSNLYVTQNVTLDIKKGDNGKIKHKLEINYKNPQIYNSWLNGINRDYVRIFVPKGSQLISSKGSEALVTTKDDNELDKTYFEAFIQVRPANSNKLSFEYEVPSEGGKELPILIQKQPGTKDYSYEVKVNGRSKHKFNLDSDKEFKLSI